MVELAGARWVGDTDVKGELPEPPVVRFRTGRADRIIGIEIEEQEQKDILESLGFDVVPGWDVHVPTWRMRDVTREIDLVEEVARVHGLEKIPFTLPLRSAMFGRLSQSQRLRRLVEDVLVGAGFFEAYTLSLVARDPDPAALRLPVPLTVRARRPADDAAGRPRRRGRAQRRRRERGDRALRARARLPPERRAAAGRALARRRDRPGRLPAREGRRRGPLRGAGDRAAAGADAAARSCIRARRRSSRPAGSASCTPSLLEGSWGVFELDLDTLFAQVPERVEYEDVVSYPALHQDLAFVVDEDVLAGDLVAAAREAAGAELRDVRDLRRLPGRADPGGEEVGGAARVLPVAGADALGRGRPRDP